MKSRLIILITAVSLASTAAMAEDHHEKQAADTEVKIATDNLVAGRRAGFWMSAGLFGGMFGVVNSGGDVKGLAFAARNLSGWAENLPGLFPAGSVNEKSNALPTIWSDRAGFEATAKLYQERTAKLSEMAKAGDNEGFKAQWAVVRETCNSCHETYRRKRERKPAPN